MSGVSVERDARAEHQSSSQSEARTGLERLSRPLELCFGGFVLLHFSGQAYRAFTDEGLAAPGFERTPWFVAGVSLVFWLPFSVFAAHRLSRWSSVERLRALTGQARALAAVEPLALALTLLFGSVHGALMAWPLLTGALDEADVRADLVASLSSTWRGVPVQGVVYLCAVGASAFCAARLTLALLPAGRRTWSRVVIGLATLAYLLGSYAVIRNGSGSLWP